MNTLRIGAHISPLATVSETLLCGLPVIQVYLGSSRSHAPRSISVDDAKLACDLITTHRIGLFTHLPLTFNPANPNFEVGMLQDHLVQLHRIHGSGVLHIGKRLKASVAEGLQHCADHLNQLQFKAHPWQRPTLLLENAAGQGTELGANWSEITTLLESVTPTTRANLGLCLDTQHTFAAGVCDFATANSVDAWFDDISDSAGLNKLALVHLNDSDRLFNSRVDRHLVIGQGYIWGQNCEGLAYLLQRLAENGTDIVLETTSSNIMRDLTFAQMLYQSMLDGAEIPSTAECLLQATQLAK